MQLTDFATLVEAQAYAETRYVDISANVAQGVLTMMGAMDELEAKQQNTTAVTLPTGTTTTIGQMCRSFLRITNFTSDPTTPMGGAGRAMGQALVDNGVISADANAALWAAGEQTVYPFANVTQQQFDAAHNPPVFVLCQHDDGSQDFVVSASPRDKFSFITTLNDDCQRVTVTLYWREDGASVWKKYASPLLLSGGNAGDVLSQVISRPIGIPQARYFQLMYQGDYAGQVEGVQVSVG